ncbi:MAG: phosphoadenosine phosphosulfate reductase family protein [Thermoplasmata archaeon]
MIRSGLKAGAVRIAPHASRGIAQVSDDALPFILEGRNLMAPGYVKGREFSVFKKTDEVILVDSQRNAVATGHAMMDSEEAEVSAKGLVVKVRRTFSKDNGVCLCEHESKTGLSECWKASREELERAVKNGCKIISDAQKQYSGKPVSVSFSGGKDSLAALLIALKALEKKDKPEVIFVDTGLEFPQTLSNVEEVVQRYGLTLLRAEAKNAFFENLPRFGLPARDYRWCCKVCKLGPVTTLIREKYPGGVISIIGQRRYESESRAKKGRIFVNPWVPNQIGVAPIHDFTSLHVWFLIFRENAPYNKLYEKGMERIGCFMCPASGMTELRIARDHPRWIEFEKELHKSAAVVSDRAVGKSSPAAFFLRENYVRAGLWRWKTLPQHIRRRYNAGSGADLSTLRSETDGSDGFTEDDNDDDTEEDKYPKRESQKESQQISFELAEGYSPCDYGYSAEGIFSKPIDINRAKLLLQMIGPVSVKSSTLFISDWLVLFPEGGLTVKGKDRESVEKSLSRAVELIIRSVACVKCGICISACSQNALELKEDGVVLIPEKCVRCFKCLEYCPVTMYGSTKSLPSLSEGDRKSVSPAAEDNYYLKDLDSRNNKSNKLEVQKGTPKDKDVAKDTGIHRKGADREDEDNKDDSGLIDGRDELVF